MRTLFWCYRCQMMLGVLYHTRPLRTTHRNMPFHMPASYPVNGSTLLDQTWATASWSSPLTCQTGSCNKLEPNSTKAWISLTIAVQFRHLTSQVVSQQVWQCLLPTIWTSHLQKMEAHVLRSSKPWPSNYQPTFYHGTVPPTYWLRPSGEPVNDALLSFQSAIAFLCSLSLCFVTSSRTSGVSSSQQALMCSFHSWSHLEGVMVTFIASQSRSNVALVFSLLSLLYIVIALFFLGHANPVNIMRSMMLLTKDLLSLLVR